MCEPCEAAKERREASAALVEAVEQRFGIPEALRAIYRPICDTPPEWRDILDQL